MGNKVKLIWPGGEHTFALNLKELRALQNACDAGPEVIVLRIARADWRVDDLIEVIRLGLIGGGGMKRAEAGPFVTKVFELHPLISFKMTAQAILTAALVGVKDDPVGEPEGVVGSPENGNSPSSTVPEQ